MECLKLIPPRDSGDDVMLKSILFSQSRSFSDFFSHDYFSIEVANTGMTPVQLFNFLPQAVANAIFSGDEASIARRKDGRNQLLREFVYAYKAFQSGEMGDKRIAARKGTCLG